MAISIFRSLRYRNYRLYYLGQLVSLNGTWMQSIAQAWLVYRLTGSSFMLGLVSFCTLFPVFLFSLFAGVLADRVDRRRLLLLATTLGIVHAVILALLVLTDRVEPWHIVLLALFIGCVHAMETPARHSFIADLVQRRDLSNAIALNSSAFNIARFMGPPIAGVLISLKGEGFVFLLNAASYLAVLLGYLLMRIQVVPRESSLNSALTDIYQSLSFAFRHIHIRSALMLVGLGSIVGASISVLMPVFTREVYAGGSLELGYLMGAMGAGALVGALALARRGSATSIERVIGYAGLTTGSTLLLFAYSHVLVLAMCLLFVAGGAQTVLAASSNTIIQASTPDRLRGRVMSLFSMIFIGMMPLGSLLAGVLAQSLGAAHTVMLFAGICIAGAILFLFYVPVFEQGE